MLMNIETIIDDDDVCRLGWAIHFIWLRVTTNHLGFFHAHVYIHVDLHTILQNKYLQIYTPSTSFVTPSRYIEFFWDTFKYIQVHCNIIYAPFEMHSYILIHILNHLPNTLQYLQKSWIPLTYVTILNVIILHIML
jgi:hypothetical protein